MSPTTMTAETLVAEPQDPPQLREVPVEVEDLEKTCREMVHNLTEDEKEHAARSSYKYFMDATSCDTSRHPSSNERERHAVAMARRHLVAEKGDQKSALKKFRDAIQYRRDVDVDGIRRCFYDFDEEETKATYTEYREHLETVLGYGARYIQGYDKKNRAIYVAIPPNDNFDEGYWVIKACVYTLERALAVSERTTGGTEEKVNVIFNYKNYGYSNNPPLSLTKELLTVLKDHYPERLENVFLVDASIVFRAFWKIIYPFVDKITRKKVKFVTGEEQKKEVLSEHIDEDQATPWMYEGGKKDKAFDVKEYLYSIPFDHAFDEEPLAN